MKKIFLISGLLGIFILSGCTTTEKNLEKAAEIIVNSPLVASQAFIDYGKIAMDKGAISMSFPVTNTGSEPVIVKRMYTSCMCTTAQLDIGGKRSSLVGMQGHGVNDRVLQEVLPGETVEVITYFDPNAHGPSGVGINQRAVYLETNSAASPFIELSFMADVVQTSAELDPFTFREKEHDFGVLKQSSGITSYDFPFTYNGTEPLTITKLLASCACTWAEMSVSELETGDEGLITIFFDPNLHEEPKGRFFKTVSLITEPEIANLPDLKIWAEIDLDLGPDAYKLSEHND